MSLLMILLGYPNWTDILQAIGAVIAIPLTLITVYKLVKRDKERESEIKSLSTIANQLTAMQIESEKRYKSSKKPFINITLEYNPSKKYVRLDFTNTNPNSTITDLKISNDRSDFKDFSAVKTTINTIDKTQHFWIGLSYEDNPFEFAPLHLSYRTEEGYLFIQDILIWLEGGRFILSPSAIIDEQNSPAIYTQ
ncbi:MAG: hypothetical protein FWD66_01850 [Paludibacter sp.]|nr:hypothetical protein [Paludibacter sp.]